MQASSNRTCDLGKASLDRHVDVFILLAEGKAALLQLALDRIQSGQQLVTVGAAMISLSASIRTCARDCAMS